MPKILPLSDEAKSKLRSGIAITSLSRCAEELILNAIDAKATCIAIRVDISVFKIQVFDNGHGFSKEDLLIAGERYATSKHPSCAHNISSTFGHRGEALASIRDISRVVLFESKTSFSSDTYVKTYVGNVNRGVSLSSGTRPSCGTTITVLDFLYNLPVRRKNVEYTLDLNSVKECVEAIALIHPEITITLRDECAGRVLIQTCKSDNSLSTFTDFYGIGKSRSMKKVFFHKEKVQISGYIGVQGNYNKSLQYLYVNKHHVHKSKIHKLVNNMCSKTIIGGSVRSNLSQDFNQKETVDDLFVNSRSLDSWCMFVLNFDCPSKDSYFLFESRKKSVEFKEWDIVLDATKQLLIKFFIEQNLFFSPKKNISEKKVELPINTHVSFTQVNTKSPKQKNVENSITDDGNKTDFTHEVVVTTTLRNNSVWSLMAKRQLDKFGNNNLNTLRLNSTSVPKSPFFNDKIDESSTSCTEPDELDDGKMLFPTRTPIIFSKLKRRSVIKSLAAKSKKSKLIDGLKLFTYKPQSSPEKQFNRLNKIESYSSKYTNEVIEEVQMKKLSDLIETGENEPFTGILEKSSDSCFLEQSDENIGPEKSILTSPKTCFSSNLVASKSPSSNFDADQVTTNDSEESAIILDTDEFGNNIYVNKFTGYSSYNAPIPIANVEYTDEFSERVSKSVINDENATSDIFEQTDVILTDNQNKRTTELLNLWKNPVFASEKDVVNIEINKSELKVQSVLHPYKFKKTDINSIKVLGQIDRKFILCLGSAKNAKLNNSNRLVILFDQHAVHERIRLEHLCKDLFSSEGLGKEISCVVLDEPIFLDMDDADLNLLISSQSYFSKYGFKFQSTELEQLEVLGIPKFLWNKNQDENKKNTLELHRVVHDMLHREVNVLKSARGYKKSMPKFIWELVCLQACRGAIKFGHILSRQVCKRLMNKLASCDLPFQCAHGRPTLFPLLDMNHLKHTTKDKQSLPNMNKLGYLLKKNLNG